MSERDTRTNQDIRIPTLGGLNERPSPANLRPGEFSHLEGLYPAQIGLLRRIPGKTLLANVEGRVLQIFPTGNVNGDVLIQTDAPALYAFTLDELRGRGTTPSLTFPPSDEEDTMSMAIIVQEETTSGGSMDGFLTGTSAAASGTAYGRRLTDLLFNETGSFGDTIVSFTQSTGGTGAASTAGQFVLAPGDYRITCWTTFRSDGSAANATFEAELYNVTSAGVEVQSGTSVPVKTTPACGLVAAAVTANMVAGFEAKITVSSSNKTYELRQKCTAGGNGPARALSAGGGGGPSSPHIYTYIKIIRTA